jgi:type IX secretion system PorP/SprF family membrane protein
MKRISFILFLFVCAGTLYGQQKPHYTQYILNNYILNPALTGIENYADVKISGRDQWVGLEGAPKTAYVSFHMPIGKKDYKTSATSFQVPGENPRGSSYWENYTASASHHGVGLIVMSDKTGLYNRFTANVSYAYHLGLSEKLNLAMGFAGGISRVGYDRSKATPANPLDPALGNSSNELFKTHPDLSVGLWLYGSSFFAGLSAQQVIPQTIHFTEDSLGIKMVPHIFATTGYRFLISEDINALPSVMVKYIQNSPSSPQFDLNIKFQYRDLLWMGGSYRYQDGYAAMVGMNINNTFNFGYAYDFTRTQLNTTSKGTHEFIIGFLLGNNYGDTCPRNVW